MLLGLGNGEECRDEIKDGHGAPLRAQREHCLLKRPTQESVYARLDCVWSTHYAGVSAQALCATVDNPQYRWRSLMYKGLC